MKNWLQPLVMTSTGADNCGVASVVVSDYVATRKGKTKNTCTTVDGATLIIGSSAGKGATHSWTVTVTDSAGLVTTIPCSFTVAKPSKSGSDTSGSNKSGSDKSGSSKSASSKSGKGKKGK